MSQSSGRVSTLETVDIVKQYKKRRVVDGISLKVERGQVVGLLGPNGAGKTTSFYSIAGLIRPDAGRILLNGEDITDLPIHQRARKGISYLAQDSSVFKKLTVEENVRIVLEALGVPRRKINKQVDTLLDELKIRYLAKNKGHSLSGGERRRVEIMRVLATEPHFILLDEPFAGIDPLSVADLQQIIYDLRNRGLGVLISDHNVRETLSVCDYAYIVNSGQILASGSAEEIVRSDTARRMYLGEKFSM
jgi:lipopolysaccharide export system ATP-binding protein